MTDGEKLKMRLAELGLPKTEFAKRIGASSQNVYILFRTRQFRLERRKLIEKVLNFKFEEEEAIEYKEEYFNLLKKYADLLEENIRLKEKIQ
jgi:predicted transcriptional regulator